LNLWQALHNALEARLARIEGGVMVGLGWGGVIAEYLGHWDVWREEREEGG